MTEIEEPETTEEPPIQQDKTSGKCHQLTSTILRGISFGKYNTKLYYDETEKSYSSVYGGVFTLLLGSVLLYLSLSLFIACVRRDNWAVTETAARLEDTMTLG